MDKWVKVKKRTTRTVWKVQKSHHFTVMKPFKPGKDNTYALSQYNDIQNQSRYLQWVKV